MQFRRPLYVSALTFLIAVSAHAGNRISPAAMWPFEENGGRYPSNVAYAGNVSTGGVFVTTDGKVVHSLRGKDDRRWSLVEVLESGPAKPMPGKSSPVTITRFHDSQSGTLRAFESLRFAAAPGIMSELRLRQGGVERWFELAPGTSVNGIRVRLDGAKSLVLERDGALRIATGAGDLRLSPPIAWQMSGETKTPVDVAYKVRGKSYSFTLGAHDPKRTVYIDPLLQSTYVGGSGAEAAFGIAIGADRVYVSGGTSGNFPGTAGGAQPVAGSGGVESDAYIAAFSLDLTTLLGATYLGGNNTDFGPALLVGEDSIYIAGNTDSTNFPGTASGPQPAFGGGTATDGFIARLSLNLTTLMRATYFGGPEIEQLHGLALTNDSLYAVGYTASSNIAATTGAAQPALAGESDAVIARFSLDLSTLTRATYLGGTGSDAAFSHPVATADSLYVIGSSDSHDFPNVAGGVDDALHPSEIFSAATVSRLSLDLSQHIQSTYYNVDFTPWSAFSVAEHFGDIFVMGRGRGNGAPGTAGGAQPTWGGGFFDLWVARFSPTLTSVVNATYYGGTDDEEPAHYGLVVSDDAVFIAGTSVSATLPGTAGGFQENNASDPGQADTFIARFSPDLTTLDQATWLGGPINEGMFGMAQAPNGVLYVCGSDESPGFPGVDGGAIENYPGGDSDGFLAAMSPDLTLVAPTPTVSIGDFAANEGNAGSTIFTFDITLSSAPGSNASVTVQTVPGTATAGTDYLTLFPMNIVFTPFGPLTRQITVQVAGDFDPEANEQFTVTLTNPNGVTIDDGTGTGTIVNDDFDPDAPAEVPTLSTVALLALALAIGGAAVIMMRS